MNGCVDKDFLKILFSTWLSEKIQSGEVQAGLHDCDGKPIGQWSKVMLCCPGCGDSGGDGGVDKFLRDVVIDKEKGAMTFKVYGGSDVVVTISDFLSDMDGYVNGAVVDNDAKTITLKVKDQDDVVINLSEMLEGIGGGGGPVTASLRMSENAVETGALPGEKSSYTIRHVLTVNGTPNADKFKMPIIGHGLLAIHDDKLGFDWSTTDSDGVRSNITSWTAPRTVVGQPSFDNDSRVLTIPVTSHISGKPPQSSNFEVTIPATGNSPGADNDTKVSTLEFVENNDNGRKVKVKLVDTAGGVFETAELDLDASGGGAENVALSRTEKDVSGVYDNIFEHDGKIYDYAFTNAAGQTQNFAEVVGTPVKFKYVVEGGGNYGLTKNEIEEYRLRGEGLGSKGSHNLAHAALGTPSLEGTVLKINLHHRQYDEKVSGSDQEVTVDLATLPGLGGTAAPPDVSGSSKPTITTGTELPTKMYGARTALLGEPDAWEEVVGSDGHTYLRPLWRKP